MRPTYVHPSGGKLFQVGASEIPQLVKNESIALIIFAAKEIQPYDSYPTIKKIFIPLKDSTRLSPAEIITTKNQAEAAANVACEYLSRGKNVISSCAAGLNRSGLTSAFILEKCTTANKQNIIDHIRQARDPWALSNPLFVRLFLTS